MRALAMWHIGALTRPALPGDRLIGFLLQSNGLGPVRWNALEWPGLAFTGRMRPWAEKGNRVRPEVVVHRLSPSEPGRSPKFLRENNLMPDNLAPAAQL